MTSRNGSIVTGKSHSSAEQYLSCIYCCWLQINYSSAELAVEWLMSHPEDPAAASSAADAGTKIADEEAVKNQVMDVLGPNETPPQSVEVCFVLLLVALHLHCNQQNAGHPCIHTWLAVKLQLPSSLQDRYCTTLARKLSQCHCISWIIHLDAFVNQQSTRALRQVLLCRLCWMNQQKLQALNSWSTVQLPQWLRPPLQHFLFQICLCLCAHRTLARTSSKCLQAWSSI